MATCALNPKQALLKLSLGLWLFFRLIGDPMLCSLWSIRYPSYQARIINRYRQYEFIFCAAFRYTVWNKRTVKNLHGRNQLGNFSIKKSYDCPRMSKRISYISYRIQIISLF